MARHSTQLFPPNFPTHIDCSLAWPTSLEQEKSRYIYRLTTRDKEEIDIALVNFKELELDGDLVSRENFPLPYLSKNLERIQDEVHEGVGFCIIRGVDLKNYTVEDGLVIFLGIQCYIADSQARQDDRGNMLVHIKSKNTPSKAEALHARYSGSSIKFHNEETGDVLAWQTRSTAVTGGSCVISSVYSIYNILSKSRPDVIQTLSQSDWPFAFPYFHYRPVLFYHHSRLIMNFGRAALLGTSGHPRDPRLPSCTTKQVEALDLVEKLANELQFRFTTQAGDMHFVNNLAIMHRREGFIDDPKKTGKVRHLVRMRLRSTSKGWPIPDSLQPFWHEAFDAPGERVWHVEPMPAGYFPLRVYPF